MGRASTTIQTGKFCPASVERTVNSRGHPAMRIGIFKDTVSLSIIMPLFLFLFPGSYVAVFSAKGLINFSFNGLQVKLITLI